MIVEELMNELKKYAWDSKVVICDVSKNGNIDRVEPFDDFKIIIIGKEGEATY